MSINRYPTDLVTHERQQRRELHTIDANIFRLSRTAMEQTEAAIGPSATYWLRTYGGGVRTVPAVVDHTPFDTIRVTNWLHANPTTETVGVYTQEERFVDGDWSAVDKPIQIADLTRQGRVNYIPEPMRNAVSDRLVAAHRVQTVLQGIVLAAERDFVMSLQMSA